jgi:hypothetical protein
VREGQGHGGMQVKANFLVMFCFWRPRAPRIEGPLARGDPGKRLVFLYFVFGGQGHSRMATERGQGDPGEGQFFVCFVFGGQGHPGSTKGQSDPGESQFFLCFVFGGKGHPCRKGQWPIKDTHGNASFYVVFFEARATQGGTRARGAQGKAIFF